ncbi:helix-turn-helix transcriptional regulator [Streptomyces sp. XM4193]|nr:helix-turn-helix transcriptional regulator [Streptomyces sp. XM4193]MCK1795941.1 helix-turn-helix transcriptional regulator [Streptomyces sp. XM4193]
MARTAPEPSDGLQYFGREVRLAREHHGATQAALAEATTYKAPYVSKVENGQQLPSDLFAQNCDVFFNTPGYFARLRRRVSQHGHPEWFVPYLKLEERAREILDFSSFLVLGMLQTPDYAQALFRASNPRDTSEQTRTRVKSRLERRAVIEQSDPPLLWVVLDESCLRRMVGSPEVMRDQIEHLLMRAGGPHVTLQVLPFRTGAPPASESFTLLRFDEDAPALYTEAQNMGRLIDAPSRVRAATEQFERLRADALSPQDSVTMLRSVMGDFTR